MTPGAGVPVIGCGHIDNIMQNALFLLIFFILKHKKKNWVLSNDEQRRIYQDC